ncbi:MAG TPA: helicase HerA-like domain-containing protein [Aromatoleum sp.]|uniref:helicase HerA-like C-terminal domain-containing protein n=1 Tax=Aromatoleum sp. TaxID=2307007 RepID=UPI002B464A45|nr:helicase HerA-like domain-containing protein [Aromatoleum sp.]HJV26493.1 helicase HerA-like domain-containing protein [Aromatoleum sp.]
MVEPLLIAKNAAKEIHLLPRLANRHGLITGATGTGKTVTLQKMAESFSAIGVPVFMADVKGDLSGIGAAGVASEKLLQRLAAIGIEDFTPRANPVVFWDVFGAAGHPVRATISDMGPLLLARLLNLNETQSGVLQLVFKIADDNGLLLLDLKDLRAMVQHVGDNAKTFTTEYGNVSAASIGAIQRGLLALEQQGGDQFFGEPMLDLADLMQTDADGRGVVNVLAADKLYQSPKLYSTFLLWMLAELFEQLPEVGDVDKPKLVFFFDEAHLLFNDAPQALVEKVEQVVRLIRSKGVGVYFVTQNPLDVPDTVLGQLGNRVQHALRAFTPRDQKAVKTAAETMRPNPAFDAAAAITELGVGEALISFLDDKGRPEMVERAVVVAPASRLGPLSADERNAAIRASVLYGHYEQLLDRESAYEKLRGKPAAAGTDATDGQATGGTAGGAPARQGGGMLGGMSDILFGSTGPRGGRNEGLVEVAARTVVRTIGSSIGREIVRGVLGSLLGGGSSRRR